MPGKFGYEIKRELKDLHRMGGGYLEKNYSVSRNFTDVKYAPVRSTVDY